MPTMQLSVKVQVLPFGMAKTQQVVYLGHSVNGNQGRQDLEAESLILPPTTIGNYVVQPAPARILNDE